MAIRPIKSIIELGVPNFTRLYRNCRELSQTQMFCSLLLASLEHLILYRKGRDLEALFSHTLGLISQELSEDFKDHNKDSFDDLEYLYDSKQIKTLNSLSYDFAFLSFLNSIHSLIEIPDNKSSENEHLHEVKFYSQQLRVNIRVINSDHEEIRFCVETPFVQLIVFQKANKFFVLYPFEYQIFALESQVVKGMFEMEDMRKNNVSGDLETEADFSLMLERSLSQRLSLGREPSFVSAETSRQSDMEQRMRNRSRLMRIKRRNTRELRLQNSLLQASKESGAKQIANVKIRIQYDKYLLEATEMEEENRVLRELKAKSEEKELGFKRSQTHMYMQGKNPKAVQQNDAEIEARIKEHETEMERLRELERLRDKERRKEELRRKHDGRLREEKRISEETLILELKRKEIERKIAEKRGEAERKKTSEEKPKESRDDALPEKNSERKLKPDKQLLEARRVYEDRKAAEENRLHEEGLLAEEKTHERSGFASKAPTKEEESHLDAVAEENERRRLYELKIEGERRLREEERVAKEKLLAEERWALEEKRKLAEKFLAEERGKQEEKRREDAKRKEELINAEKRKEEEKRIEDERKREEEFIKERQEASRKEEERRMEEIKRKEEIKKRIEEKKAEQQRKNEEERKKKDEFEEKRKEKDKKEEEARKIKERQESEARLREEQKKKEEIEEKRLLEKKRLAEEMRLADARRKAEELTQQEKRRRQDPPQPAVELPEAATLNTPEETDNTSYCGGSYCFKCLRELKRSNYLLKCETCCERFFKGSSIPSSTTRPQRSSTALCMNCGAKVLRAEPITCMCCFIQEKVFEGPAHNCNSCVRTDKCYWIDAGEGDARDMMLCGFCDEKKHMETVLIACQTCRDTVCLICLRKNPYVAQGICWRCHNRRQVQFV